MSTSLEKILGDQFCTFFHQRWVDKRKPSPGQRMLELSEKERYEALHDLHGVPDEVNETPELVDQCLGQMEAELDKIALSKEGKHYKKAFDMSPSFVRAQSLRCLRAKSFKVAEAAKLMKNMFELKSRLFGDSKLTKELTMSDLEPEDVVHCNTGFFQILPHRDPAGRKILFFAGKMVQEIPIDTTIRLNFIVTATLEEEDQKKGVVILYYGLGQKGFNRELPFQFAAARECMPYRSVANHFVYDNPLLRQFMPLVEFAISIFDLSRFRHQFGSHMEIQYYLQTFGIPSENFPASEEDGSLDLKTLQMNLRLFDDKSGPPPSRTNMVDMDETNNQNSNPLLPGPNDVIMGRNARTAPGNVLLRRMLEEYSEQYDRSTDRLEKSVVAHHVFTSIRERGGRFLRQRKDDKVWEEVSEEIARQKIALGFRNLRRPAHTVSCGRKARRRTVG